MALIMILGPSSLASERVKAEDAGLGRGIGVLADGGRDAAGQCVERRHAGDAAAVLLLQHDRRNGVDVVEAALEIDRDGAVELLLLDLQDAPGVRRAGVVQQEVDAAPLPGDIIGDLVRAGEHRDIGLVGPSLAADPLDLTLGVRHFELEQVDQRDVVAAPRQFERATAADAAGSARDDGDLAHAACALA
jgi:hypothetical protein